MKLLLNRRYYEPRELSPEILIAWATLNNIPMLKGSNPIRRSDDIAMEYLALENIETDAVLIGLFEARPHLFSAGFQIIEIPDGVDYEIIEGYDDGYQTVVEKGRSW